MPLISDSPQWKALQDHVAEIKKTWVPLLFCCCGHKPAAAAMWGVTLPMMGTCG